MSQYRKRPYDSGSSNYGGGDGKGGDTRQKRPRQESRGPAEIASYFATIRSVRQLSERVSEDVTMIILDGLDMKQNEDFTLDGKAQICALELVECSFRSGALPRALLSFLADNSTLQEVKFLGTHLEDQQWNDIVQALDRNSSVRRVSISSDSCCAESVLPLIRSGKLEYLQLGDVKIQNEQLRELITTKSLKTLELKRPGVEMQSLAELAMSLDGMNGTVAQLIVTEEQEAGTEAKWTTFQRPILKAQLCHSLRQSDCVIISEDSKEELFFHAIGFGSSEAEQRPKMTKQVANTSHRLPRGVLAVVPVTSSITTAPLNSSENHSSIPTETLAEQGSADVNSKPPGNSSDCSYSFKFGTNKAKLIVVEMPALEPNKLLREIVDFEIMPLLLSCLHQLEDDCHLLVVDFANVSASRQGGDWKKCVDLVWAETEKRLFAFFNTERIGSWVTSRELKKRINILFGELDKTPAFGVDNSLASSALSPDSFDSAFKSSCWKKVSTSLPMEYGRYLLSHELYTAFDLRGLNFNQKRDVQAILEQWFMLRANGEDADRYPVQELVSKRVCAAREAEGWVSYITSAALRPPPTPRTLSAQRVDLPLEHGHPLVTLLRYGAFSEKVQRSRVDALLSAASRHGSKHPLDALLTMMMRYGTVFGNFRQYCTNENLFQELVDLGVHCEGFASPFNAQILISKPPIGDAQAQEWNPTFCSCFQDSDAIFGSLGSFFHQTFDGMHVFLNPPTVDSVLTKTMRYIHEQMEKFANTKFHVLLPAWEDLQAYQAGISSHLLVKNRAIDSHTYPSQNPYTGESHPSGKKFLLLSFESKSVER